MSKVADKIQPRGNGLYVWQIRHLLTVHGGTYEGIAKALKAARIDWVMVKIVNGWGRYNLRPTPTGYKDDLVEPFCEAMKAAGIRVWAWGYVYLLFPSREATKTIARYNQFGKYLDGYIVNAEHQAKGRYNQAREYMGILRQGLPDVHLSVSTYRFPALHPRFPLKAFWKDADSMMPQVYWMQAHNPTRQLEKTLSEYKKFANNMGLRELPIYPTGAAFQEHGWRASDKEIMAFTQAVIDQGLKAMSNWESRAAVVAGLWPAVIAAGDVWRNAKGVPDIDQPEPPPELPNGDTMTLEQRVDDNTKRITELEGD